MNLHFQLPDRHIAREPQPREQARLLVVHRDTGDFEHRRITDLPSVLGPEHHLVLNDSAVVPSTTQLDGEARVVTWDPLRQRWFDHGSPAHVVHPARPNTGGTPVALPAPNGVWLGQSEVTFPRYLAHLRTWPGRTSDFYDNEYASCRGSIALPSGGRNLTTRLLTELDAVGVTQSRLTLHVGTVTFRHPDLDALDHHEMAAEYYEISRSCGTAVECAQRSGKRLVAVGTTSTRALEDAAARGLAGGVRAEAEIFIRPGHEFRTVDGLLTGFHAPGSSLLLLVAALAGEELLMAAYAEALREDYRWYTLGDSMLVL